MSDLYERVRQEVDLGPSTDYVYEALDAVVELCRGATSNLVDGTMVDACLLSPGEVLKALAKALRVEIR